MRILFKLVTAVSALLCLASLWFGLVGIIDRGQWVTVERLGFRVGYSGSGFDVSRISGDGFGVLRAMKSGQYVRGAGPGLHWYLMTSPLQAELFVAHWAILSVGGVLPILQVVLWIRWLLSERRSNGFGVVCRTGVNDVGD